MTKETKRDVFEYYLDMINGLKDPLAAECVREARKRYAAALPDDLPVIPKVVGEYIQERKAAHDSLAFALTARFIPNEVVEWMFMVAGDPDTELSQIEYAKQQDTFALAWVLGIWRVEETGEIVKLEEAK